MRFVLVEKNIKLNKRFVTLLDNARALYKKQDFVYFLNNELILFYNFEKSLNGNNNLNFFCYYFFDDSIFTNFEKELLNMSYERLLRKNKIVYFDKSNIKPTISSIRWYIENENNMEMLYLSTFSNKPFSEKEISKIKNEEMNLIMEKMSKDIIEYTYKMSKDYVRILKLKEY